MTNPILVVGASRGFGAATTTTLARNGHPVVAIARNHDNLAALATQAGPNVTAVVGDGRDPDLARRLLAEHQPVAVIVGGGATPHMAPLEDHTFETLSLHWNQDVAIAFTWLQATLTSPNPELRDVVVISSGAGLFGSPGSGGYAGSKATTRFLTASAADSAKRLGHHTRYRTVNPKLTSATDTGKAAVAGYARITGTDVDQALAETPLFTAEHAGDLIAALTVDPDSHDADHYLLTETALQPI